MRNNSRLMYKIGRIFSFVFLGLAAGLFVLNLILMIVHISKNEQFSGDIGSMVSCVIWAALLIVLIVLASKAMNDIDQDSKNNGPHIVMIVFGALTGDIFYILGGVFGLIAIGQETDGQNQEPKQVEEKKEEKK